MKIKELQEEFTKKQMLERARIKSEQNKWKRFWKWVWYLLIFPWKWAFVNVRDWRTLIIFLIVTIIYSGSVWGFYLASLLCGWTNTDAGKWLLGIGSAVWAWWLSPAGSPFILLCVLTTIGVKAIFNKVKHYMFLRKVSKRLKDDKNRSDEINQ